MEPSNRSTCVYHNRHRRASLNRSNKGEWCPLRDIRCRFEHHVHWHHFLQSTDNQISRLSLFRIRSKHFCQQASVSLVAEHFHPSSKAISFFTCSNFTWNPTENSSSCSIREASVFATSTTLTGSSLHSISINLRSSLSIMVVFVELSSLLTCSAAAPFSSTWADASEGLHSTKRLFFSLLELQSADGAMVNTYTLEMWKQRSSCVANYVCILLHVSTMPTVHCDSSLKVTLWRQLLGKLSLGKSKNYCKK